MIPIDEALRSLGLADSVRVLRVQSGYPAPRTVNLVLRRHAGRTLLFECSAARPDIRDEVLAALAAEGVRRLDALVITHCHGDHGGAAGIVSGIGRPEGERAPIFLHSAGYRFLTHPEASFLHETYEIFLARAHWGLIEYNALADRELVDHELRRRYRGFFAETPMRALSFVDHGQLPEGLLALHTPGHSHDCTFYFDEALGIAIPGDTLLTTGRPDDPSTHGFAIPIFTVAGQVYSMAFAAFLRTIRRLRRFFSEHEVRAVIPPHGAFAITEPIAWCSFAERYFETVYQTFRGGFLNDPRERWASRPFRARDLRPYLPTAGSHPISTASHGFGMLCLLADEGYLGLEEDPHTRQITFRMRELPPSDWLEARLAEKIGPLALLRGTR
ncbi:MAG: MBL fold metallo-hydrolase [Myxococcales bacterium]|nr:MBL fold metallo-hydrolase [Myxococcales bacterium]